MAASQITFTNDVGKIATASNTNGSIRWHVYERDLGGGVTSIYVQRELSGVLQPEVRFVRDGRRPAVFFDTVSAQWILLYEFNESVWMIRADETTAPILQISQLGTFITHMRSKSSDDSNDQSVAERLLSMVDSLGTTDCHFGPASMQAVAVCASPTIGTFEVRWLPQFILDSTDAQGFNKRIVGFNVYLRDDRDGAVTRVNPGMIPFLGDNRLHSYATPGRAGTWMVTQIEQWGLGRLVEGRLGYPKDRVPGTGTTLPVIIEAIMDRKCGHGNEGSDIVFTFVSFAPLTINVAVDTFPGHTLGESPPFVEPVVTTVFSEFFAANESDTFPGHARGDTIVPIRITQTGFDVIVVG